MPISRERTTTTTYAVLGLLSVRAWSTYELAKQVQRSLNWFWPRAERKLYDEPKRLVVTGLATASTELTGRRPRTVYAITAAGSRELRRWLSEPSAAPLHESEAVLKVFFADAGNIGQLRTTVNRIGQEATDRIVRLGELTGAISDSPAFPSRLHLNALTVRLQLEQELSVLRWATWAETQIDEWKAADDPGGWDTAGALADVVIDAYAVTHPEASAPSNAPGSSRP